MALTEVAEAAEAQSKGKGHLRRAMERLVRKKIAVLCIVVLAVIYFAGIFAPLIAPYDYTEPHFTEIRKPPSLQFWAGTDFAGRDVFTRVLWGIQNTVIITIIAMATGGLLIGITMGLISGYFSSKVDSLIMRTGELFASFPDILLVIILAYALRPRFLEMARSAEENLGIDGIVRSGVVDYLVVSLALVSFGWVGMARLVRGQVLSLKQTPFVEAARAARCEYASHTIHSPAAECHQYHRCQCIDGYGRNDRHRDHTQLAGAWDPAAATEPRRNAPSGWQPERAARGPVDADSAGSCPRGRSCWRGTCSATR